MKTPVSTEGRVFVAQLTRGLAARERAGANALAPGSTNWDDAFHRFGRSLRDVGSPTKAAKLFAAARERLQVVQNDGACFVNTFMSRSRTALFEVLTWEVSRHPLTGIGYDGIAIRSHIVWLRRGCRIMIGGKGILAFVSWHALARMNERGNLDIFAGTGIAAVCGMAGYLMRDSERHANTELNLATEDDIICTGALRVIEHENKGYGFFDVTTTLALDGVSEARRDQGVAMAWAVHEYVMGDDPDPTAYAEKIAVPPFHGTDFVSRELTKWEGTTP